MFVNPERFQGRVAIVTGASSGIGRAITLRLASEGAQVLALDASESVRDVVELTGPAVTAITCDTSSPEETDAAYAFCHKSFGHLDILVNNAGITGPQRRIHEYELADWDRVMAVNLRGAFYVLRCALAWMLEAGGGAVVNTASIGSFRATPNVGAYLASKGGLAMLTRAAAVEYVDDGIRVNAVCPATVETPMISAASPDVRRLMLARAPMGRFAKAEEVASLALYLLSDEASYITGQCYMIDGGQSAW